MVRFNEKMRLTMPIERWVALTVGAIGLYSAGITTMNAAVAKEATARVEVLKQYSTREEIQGRLFSIERELFQIRSDQRLLLLEFRRRK